MADREKVAKLLLDFFTEDSLAKGWFVGRSEEALQILNVTKHIGRIHHLMNQHQSTDDVAN